MATQGDLKNVSGFILHRAMVTGSAPAQTRF